MKRTTLSLATLLVIVAYICSSTALAQNREWGVNRSIQKISDSVFRWGSDNQYGAYIVGSEAIAVVDGHYCPSGTVQWLKAELARRHDVPVKYVILSHDHPDHICNSQVFDDTAIAIGHRNILPHIVRENRQSMVPDITFDESMDILLGGVTVRLFYFGPSHSDNLIQVYVPDENVMIAVDLAKGKSLFPDYRDMDVHSTLRILKMLGNMGDIDVVLPGHGPISDQQNFRDQHRYLQALRDEVLHHMVAGKSLAEIRDIITLDEFSDYGGYDRWLDQNIVTMWDYLYRYREPNQRITEDEAVLCRQDVSQCRTADPPASTH
ncbi:MAG: MBL fold metallo-hydrolase [Gammaproteobacteria bacterium]|nr:MBL fold metallo-hydrolase [Gammaproteobacteria bacterium]